MGENYKPHAPAAESAATWCGDENGNWSLTSLTNWLSHPLLLAFLSLPYNFLSSVRVFSLPFPFAPAQWGLYCSFCPDPVSYLPPCSTLLFSPPPSGVKLLYALAKWNNSKRDQHWCCRWEVAHSSGRWAAATNTVSSGGWVSGFSASGSGFLDNERGFLCCKALAATWSLQAPW